jgi:hypothetical protein
MNRPSLGSWLAIPIAVAVVLSLVWLGGIAYWNVAVRNAISRLRENKQDIDGGRALERAGSRAIPHLLREVDRAEQEKHRTMLVRWSVDLAALVARLDPIRGPHGLSSAPFDPVLEADSPDLAKSKCQHIRDWWARESKRYPAAWRFWDGGGPAAEE